MEQTHFVFSPNFLMILEPTDFDLFIYILHCTYNIVLKQLLQKWKSAPCPILRQTLMFCQHWGYYID